VLPFALRVNVMEQDSPKLFVIRVLRAELHKSFDMYGRMDPYAVVRYKPQSGKNKKLSTTATHWDGHMKPVWDHACPGLDFQSCNIRDQVVFEVYERNFGMLGMPSFCGDAFTSFEELLRDGQSDDSSSGSFRELTLNNKHGKTGTICVQGLLVSKEHTLARSSTIPTRVASDMFKVPVKRMGVSGGTAPFFNLELEHPGPNQSKEYFIGKDLSRAADEIAFYEETLTLQKDPDSKMNRLLAFTFEYQGVFGCHEEGWEHGEKMDLLVLRNLRDGCKRHRMIDLKIGQKTSQGGWQGKSYLHAIRQDLVDGMTNSVCEGFRLEGFDGRPSTLSSMEDFVDGAISKGNKIAKKANRLMLQRMSSPEILMHFFDLHKDHSPTDPSSISTVFSPSEFDELIIHTMACRLIELAIACRQCPVPQKWIGSSVGLGFDCGYLPPRSTSEVEIRMAAKVYIFDWGRSELNTVRKHMLLSDSDKRDRAKFWRFYVGGIDRLAFEVSRFYHHHFGTSGWEKFMLSVFDFDSCSSNDFIGNVTVEAKPTPLTTAQLHAPGGSPVVDKITGNPSTITYSIDWLPLPQTSRLDGVWQVRIVRAQNLQRMDLSKLRGTSDPFVEVIAISGDNKKCSRGLSSVLKETLNPEWDETFEIPVARADGALLAGINSISKGFSGDALDDILLPPLIDLQSHSGMNYLSETEKLAESIVCGTAHTALSMMKVGSESIALRGADKKTQPHVDAWCGQLDRATLLGGNAGTYGSAELDGRCQTDNPSSTPQTPHAVKQLSSVSNWEAQTSRERYDMDMETGQSAELLETVEFSSKVEPVVELPDRTTQWQCKACKCM